jgi:hypothetical protein
LFAVSTWIMIALLDIAGPVLVLIWLNSCSHVLSSVGPCLWDSAIIKPEPALLVRGEAVAVHFLFIVPFLCFSCFFKVFESRLCRCIEGCKKALLCLCLVLG